MSAKGAAVEIAAMRAQALLVWQELGPAQQDTLARARQAGSVWRLPSDARKSVRSALCVLGLVDPPPEIFRAAVMLTLTPEGVLVRAAGVRQNSQAAMKRYADRGES